MHRHANHASVVSTMMLKSTMDITSSNSRKHRSTACNALSHTAGKACHSSRTNAVSQTGDQLQPSDQLQHTHLTAEA